METGVRGLNGQHARQLVEMAQCPEHVTVTILVNNMAACLVRGGEMTNCIYCPSMFICGAFVVKTSQVKFLMYICRALSNN